MNPHETVRRFIQAWNTDDDAVRLRLLESCCAPDAQFSDPNGHHRSSASLSGAIGAFRRGFPKAVVVHGAVDFHHGYARFRWQTRWNDGREPVFGDDIAELDSEGRIRRLVSFNGSPASPPDS